MCWFTVGSFRNRVASVEILHEPETPNPVFVFGVAEKLVAVTHSDTYVIGDAHTNTCENCHSFLRQWLAKFRGVSKHHL